MAEIVLLNYANKLFKKSQEINVKTAKKVGGFTAIRSFSDKDIDDNFRNRNQDILTIKRGAGLWLWKPYFIHKVLSELEFGDYVFYCDSGSYFLDCIDLLIRSLDVSGQSIMCFDLNHSESSYSKKAAIEAILKDTGDKDLGNQRLASFILIKKDDFSVNFVAEWLEACQVKDWICDVPETDLKDEITNFVDHRHDQSLFSLLTKKYNLQSFCDPSQYGNEMRSKFSNSLYGQVLVLTRKRTFPMYIRFLKFLQHTKSRVLGVFSS